MFYFSEDRAKCLYNDPVALGKQVARILPGKVMSLDEQCNKILGTKACNVSFVHNIIYVIYIIIHHYSTAFEM